MDIREQWEKREIDNLSPYAAKSAYSKGRKVAEAPCQIRTCFARDRDRIIHSKAFRRLKDKTQVFIAPKGDHYRTRLTHTLEVSQIARTIARALFLNEDLVEAIALGHDLGHTPFGHEGEKILNDVSSRGFAHNIQSGRIVEIIEREGKGLNLSLEVTDGIINHRTAGKPCTIEGEVVRLSDKIAYIHHDFDDAKRAGIISEEDIPKDIKEILGSTCKERLDTMIKDAIESSKDSPHILQSEDVKNAMGTLRSLMFDLVYTKGKAKTENIKVERMLTILYDYYMKNYREMSVEYLNLLNNNEDLERVVLDYISGMTDQYAIHIFNEKFQPSGWQGY